MRVGILGGGNWGQALARLVKAAGNEPYIAYQGKRPPHVLPSTNDPPKVTATCDLILVATSAARTRDAIRLAKPGPGNRIVIAGRGIDPATGTWLADVVAEECDAIRLGALAGPAPADEILNGGLCAGVVASPFAEVRAKTIAALHSSRYRTYESDDLIGIQLTSAMVPVLAALMGFGDHLRGSGVGLRATVLARGLAEGARLARALGADPASFLGLAGIGDLVAVQATPSNAYYEAGAALARGEPHTGPVAIARALVGLAQRNRVELPLTEAYVAMAEGADPLSTVQGLMTRQAQPERR